MIVDSAGDQGKHASMVVVGTKVFIAYFELPLNLKLAVCATGGCGAPTIRTLDTTGASGLFTSIAISADNAPIVAYAQAQNLNDFSAGGTVRVVKCNRNAGNTCDMPSAPALVQPSGTSVPGTAIAVGADGMPVVGVAYNQLLRCVSPECGIADIKSTQFLQPTGGSVGTSPRW